MSLLLSSLLLRYLVSALVAGSGVFSPLAPPDPEARIGVEAPELELIGHGDKAFKLSGLRGKWVLLLFGATWSPESEATALVGSNIREALEGYPFEFVQVYDDPSVWDGELFGFTQFAGLSAVAGRQTNLAYFYKWPPPAWYLLDPKGIVRAAGRTPTPDSLRLALNRAWQDDPAMKGSSISATALQAKCEKMVRIDVEEKPQAMADLAESILHDDPGSELAMRFLLHAVIRTKGYTEGNKLLAEKTSGRTLTDPTKIYMSDCLVTDSDMTKNRDELLRFAAKYPRSQYLRCIELPFIKLPDELTDDERRILFSAWRHPRSWNTKLFWGFRYQWEGQPRKAEKYFNNERGRGIVGQLALADQINRQGREDEAKALLRGRAGLAPDNANPVEAWEQMHANTVLMDWKTGADYARKYQLLRPEKVQGLLVEWLAARCSGDKERAGELRKQSLDLIRSGNRYEVAAKLLDAGREPSVRDLTDIGDLNVRFDTALLFVMLDWEDKTNSGPALGKAQLAFKPGVWPYDVFNKIRSLGIQKPPPGGLRKTTPRTISDALAQPRAFPGGLTAVSALKSAARSDELQTVCEEGFEIGAVVGGKFCPGTDGRCGDQAVGERTGTSSGGIEETCRIVGQLLGHGNHPGQDLRNQRAFFFIQGAAAEFGPCHRADMDRNSLPDPRQNRFGRFASPCKLDQVVGVEMDCGAHACQRRDSRAARIHPSTLIFRDFSRARS
ncbi:MAG: hypothetical protein WCS65_04570 [Verrucomicrobiae bacterium]